MQRWKMRSLGLFIGFLGFSTLSAFSQNTVVGNNNPKTFSAAVAAGGTVTFSFDGTITLTNTITISNSVAVDGTGHEITISGGAAVRMFIINSGASVSLINVTLADGTATNGPGPVYVYEGAAINNGGSLLVEGCVFTNNSTTVLPGYSEYEFSIEGLGGAIFNAGLLTVSNSIFTGNNAFASEPFNVAAGSDEGCGGALYNTSNAVIANCTFSSNSAVGAIGGTYPAGPFPPISGFQGGPGYGGAICSTGSLAVYNSTFVDNTAAGDPVARELQVISTPPKRARWGAWAPSALGGPSAMSREALSLSTVLL